MTTHGLVLIPYGLAPTPYGPELIPCGRALDMRPRGAAATLEERTPAVRLLEAAGGTHGRGCP